jgi:hypothetical protein
MQPFVYTYVMQGIKLYNSLIKAGPVYRALLARQVRDADVHKVAYWFCCLRAVLTLLMPHEGWAARFTALSASNPIP